MTKEERQILIKDICARFPYRVMCRLSAKGSEAYIDRELKFGGLEHLINGSLDVKPYLRPMSSMTEKEKEEFVLLQDKVLYNSFGPVTADVMAYVNYLLAHHLDFRGFIPMGLALEASEDMYKID